MTRAKSSWEMVPAFATVSHDGGRWGWTGYRNAANGSTGSSSGYSGEQVFAALDDALPVIRFDMATIDQTFENLKIHDAYRINETDAAYHWGRPLPLAEYLDMVRALGIPVETIGAMRARGWK